MSDELPSLAPSHVIDRIDQSVRDIACGHVEDAGIVQAEAWRMLADHERALGNTAP